MSIMHGFLFRTLDFLLPLSHLDVPFYGQAIFAGQLTISPQCEECSICMAKSLLHCIIHYNIRRISLISSSIKGTRSTPCIHYFSFNIVIETSMHNLRCDDPWDLLSSQLTHAQGLLCEMQHELHTCNM